MDNDFATGYAIGQSDSNSGNGGNSGGMWGDGSWIFALIIIALLFGGGFGFGGLGGFGGGGYGLQGMATRADINAGFQFNDIQNGIRGVQQGICDSTYALNNAITGGFHNTTVGMMQGFNGVERGFCDLSHQLSDCCCENRAAIADLKYTIATEDCATRNLLQNTTRDLIDNQNANTRSILDFLVKDKIDTLTAENQSLKFQASQAQQNAFITANQDAQTAELIRRIAPMPVPAYTVPAPYPYGYAGYNGGCGCGCA